MTYLVRFRWRKPHEIAHYVHKVNGVEGALCSATPTPADGDKNQGGRWELLENLPPNVRLCHLCQKRKQKLENPLPERVERELEKLALWDPQAAERQRQKMLVLYQAKQTGK
ncbi:MAG: hypothetical protein WAS33_01285 [Candidatus Promineifilaceae bacterium]